MPNYLQCNVIRGNSVDALAAMLQRAARSMSGVGTVRLIRRLDAACKIPRTGSAINVGNISGANPPNTIRLQSADPAAITMHGSNFRSRAAVDLGAGADTSVTAHLPTTRMPADRRLQKSIRTAAWSGSLTLLSSILQN
jgi:hypothetical protein